MANVSKQTLSKVMKSGSADVGQYRYTVRQNIHTGNADIYRVKKSDLGTTAALHPVLVKRNYKG